MPHVMGLRSIGCGKEISMGSVGSIIQSASSKAAFAPSDEDIISRENYYNDTDVPVNVSAKAWQEEVDSKGVPNDVYHYMDDSSINERLRTNQLTTEDSRSLDSLDKFTRRDTLKAGDIVYSGVSSEKMLQLFDKKAGSIVNLPSYLSVSPDPTYAHGYGVNTGTVLKIVTSSDTRIGKTYYEDSTGTEGIFGRGRRYKIGKSYFSKIGGERVRIIEVSV